jgi:hypothetical protein
MLGNLDFALRCAGVHHQTDPTNRPGQPTASFWPIVSALLTFWEQLREGLAAHRHYERLRSRGVPHGAALRESLGIGPTRSHDAGPLGGKPGCS